MFEWLSSLLTGMAYDAAIYSAGLASNSGMHQIKEPEGLQDEAKSIKNL